MNDRPPQTDLLAPLSKRERMIAERFAEGLTHREIGEALFIAPTTVRTHIAAIYRKLEITNKAALVRLWAARANSYAQPDGEVALAEELAAARTPGPGDAGAASRAEVGRRQLTVLNGELRGLFQLGQETDPEELCDLIAAYHHVCREVIARFDGFVASSTGGGGAVQALFGHPAAHEDDPERGVRAGLELVETVAQTGARLGRPVQIAVGIATGQVVVDTLSPDALSEPVVVGGTPHDAARLQSFAEPGQMVVADTTRRLVGDGFAFRKLSVRGPEGMAEPVKAFAVVGEREAESRFDLRSGPRLLPMVGRDQELALLLERWARAKAGEGQGVLLVGEAGIGKSRLVRALLEALADEPHFRIRYQCSPYHTDSALWPVIRQLIHSAGLAAADSSDARLDRLEALLAVAEGVDAAPLIASLVGLDGEGRYGSLGLSPQAQRERTLAALLDQMLGLAAQKPVLVVLEDAHWIDPTTLELVEQGLQRIASARVLILLTSRPEEQPALAGHPHITRLALNRLGHAGVEAIVARLGGDKALPAEVTDAIIARTDGVPLFVEQLTKVVLESGLLTDAGDRFDLAGPIASLAIPDTLHDSLVARLDRLAPVRDIAQIGACIGRDFGHELLACVADRREPDLTAALDRLVAAELIFRRGTPPEATYSFKHALVQDAAYQLLLRSKRRELHARIAMTLEQRFPHTADRAPEVLAHHLTEAGLIERAIPYWRRAGEQASARYANAEAMRQLDRALELLATLSESRERDREELSLRVAIMRPWRALRSFGFAELDDCADRARQLAGRLGDAKQDFVCTRAVWNGRLMRGPMPRALEISSELVGLSEQTGDPVQRAVALLCHGYSLYSAGRVVESGERFTESIAIAEPSAPAEDFWIYNEHHPAVIGRMLLSQIATMAGEIGRASKLCAEGVAIARRLAIPAVLIRALHVAGSNGRIRRDAEGAEIVAEEGLLLAREHQATYWESLARGLIGWARVQRGQVKGGIAEMELSFREFRAQGLELNTPSKLGFLAEARLAAGDIAAARAHVDAALAHAERFQEGYLAPELHRIDAACRRHEGRPAPDVERALGRAIGIADGQGARLLQLRATCDLARLWTEQGERRKAHDLLAPVYGSFTEGFDTADLEDAEALLDELT